MSEVEPYGRGGDEIGWLDPEAAAGLAYVRDLARAAHPVARWELETFLDSPSQRTETTSTLSLLAAVALFNTQTQELETKVDWLERLGWIAVDGFEKVHVTDLGEAILRAAGLHNEHSRDLALPADDPLSVPRLIETVGELADEDAILVDPYLRSEQFALLVEATELRKALGGRLKKHEMAALKAAGEAIEADRPIEVRLSDDEQMHDRYLIPSAGPVYMLGVSLNGVARRFSALAQLDQPVADAVRRTFIELWNSADPIVKCCPK